MGWYLDDDVLVVTTEIIAETVRMTRAYDASPFAELGFTADDVAKCVSLMTRSQHDWVDSSAVGNVVHVRSAFSTILKVEGLLRALRTGGRVRYVDQTQRNGPAREALSRKLLIPENELTLVELASEIERALQVTVRIDNESLRKDGISEYELVYVPGIEQHVNQLVKNVAGVALQFIPRHGALCLLTAADAEEHVISVLYDVSDLLVDGVTYDDLIEVIQNETAGPWFGDIGFIAEVESARLLLMHHNENAHRDVRALLSDQRRLMRFTQPSEKDLAEVRITGYELKLETAEDVVDLIPELIAPDTWRTDEHPDRTGWIRIISKGHQPAFDGGGFYSSADDPASSGTQGGGSVATIERQAVLVVRQTRAVHKQIHKWLEALFSPNLDWDSSVPTVDLSLD